MSSSANLALPYLAASQAQKHVTVNEAFERLDAMTQLSLLSVSTNAPPSSPADGDVYGLPAGSVNEWAGEDGKLALFLNGGWAFVSPKTGWRAWVQDAGALAVFDGAKWVIGLQGLTQSGASLTIQTIESDHTIGSGPTSSTSPLLPSHALIFAVTGVVTDEISGALGAWEIGVSGSSDRYGSGLGLPTGSWFRGVTSSPQTYYADTSLMLTASGGDFAGGSVRLAVHYAEFGLPTV